MGRIHGDENPTREGGKIMAQISFKGKSLVWNHHLGVEYHELVPDKAKSLTDKISLKDNLIIHGDNLKALKALLPTYAGKVKCIYIDPPYNTGNEGWAYSDNVSSPMIKDWLGKTVDIDDLTRHDKWLCMMTPRLKILRELLADDGAIFVSIDDNEQPKLKLLLEEVFGEENYLNTFCWVSNLKGRQISGAGAAKTYEYILAFAKNIANSEPFNIDVGLAKSMMPAAYKGLDYEEESDGTGSFVVKNELYNTNSIFNEETRPNLVFNIHYNFATGQVKFSDVGSDTVYDKFIKIAPKKNNDGSHKYHAWRWSREKIERDLADLKFEMAAGGAKVSTKIRDFSGTVLKDLVTDINTTTGSKTLKEIFGREIQFDYPKPVELVDIFVRQFGKSALVLDSFAGTGTTAHAVLGLNKEDGGNRKFILVEMEDYADKITAERIRRVIKGVPTAKDEKLKNGLGGSFSYFGLGDAIDEVGILSGKSLPSYQQMARYLFYTATGEEFDESKVDEAKNFIGASKDYEVYLFYKPDIEYLKNTALNLEKAEALPAFSGKRRLVFAPAKYLDQEHLDKFHIDFAQLPFEIYKQAT